MLDKNKKVDLNLKIDEDEMREAEEILGDLGLPLPVAIELFLKQVVLSKGIPFEIKLPNEDLMQLGEMDQQHFNNIMTRGYEELLHGKTTPSKQVYEQFRRKYNL